MVSPDELSESIVVNHDTHVDITGHREVPLISPTIKGSSTIQDYMHHTQYY